MLRWLVEDVCAGADPVVRGTDNRNTHPPACLDEAFEPERARRRAARLAWPYTPKQGSWLDRAAIELSVLARPCRDRRSGVPEERR